MAEHGRVAALTAQREIAVHDFPVPESTTRAS